MNEIKENEEHEGMDPNSIRSHEELTKFKSIANIKIGKFDCETWYKSPYPSGYHNIDTLFICDFCLNLSNRINT